MLPRPDYRPGLCFFLCVYGIGIIVSQIRRGGKHDPPQNKAHYAGGQPGILLPGVVCYTLTMERIDDLQLKGLKIIQDSNLFCFGTDAVLLADFAEIPKGARVVDLGTGGGILPLLLYGRQKHARYFGIELQPGLASLAQRSVELNGLGESIEIVQGDLANAYKHFGNANDIAVANPPYEKANDGAARSSESHRIARKEVCITFDGLCKSAARLLKTGGKFYMIHKASRLPELFSTLKAHRLEPKLLRFVEPHKNEEPKYTLLCAVKDAAEHLRIAPPLILADERGGESDELRRIYRRERG
ncbi:methyltransferase [Christensenellaceae bacterium OttesenSCG-928-K19]|nr:methyltransferase [Christensenellaceae bacterium OttesenSCG-928-K19]